MTETRRDLKNILWIFCLTLGLVKLVSLLKFIPVGRDSVLLLAGAVQILVPMTWMTRQDQKITFMEPDWRSGLRSLELFLIVSLLIFPVFFGIAHLYETLLLGKTYFLVPLRQAALFISTQIILIALPEEFFFRGWLQSSLNKIFPKRWSFLGASFGVALPLTALVFAFSHSLISLQWWHFSIFFPALVFGWLRERSGGLLAPVLFHATSNVVIRLIAIRYL